MASGQDEFLALMMFYWFLENPVLWAGSESIGYAENMIKGD
jgi:hypothetical protein